LTADVVTPPSGPATVDVRLMAPDDVYAAGAVWDVAFADMRARAGLPARPHDDVAAERTRARLRHFLVTDPAGSWVAAAGEAVVGVAQASRRGPLWLLSLLGVAVAVQGRGIGGRLLDATRRYALEGGPGLILSSADPRAIRRYVAAGFDLHPVVSATGVVRRDGLPAVDGVRAGSPADIGLTVEVDQAVRGAARADDVRHLLDDGVALMVVEERGYALVRGAQPVALAATDDQAARALLTATLAGGEAGQAVEVGWLSAGQQWAMDIVVAAGLGLRPSGAIMVRGLDGPPRPYIANGAFG